MTPEQFKKICPRAHDDWVAAFIEQMPLWGINTQAREAAFIAQFAVETAEFTAFDENLNYSSGALMRTWPRRFPTPDAAAPYEHQPEKLANFVYGNRADLGNNQPGDGWLYRGRGPQLTGRANYRAAGLALGLPLEEFPEQVCRPTVGAQVAGWYWYSRGCSEYADRGEIVAVSGLINTGRADTPAAKIIGLDQRVIYFNKAQAVLKTAAQPMV